MHPQNSTKSTGVKADKKTVSTRNMWRNKQEPLVQLGEGTQSALRQKRVPPSSVLSKTGGGFAGEDYSRLHFPEEGAIDRRALEEDILPSSMKSKLTGLPLGLTGMDYNLSFGGAPRGPPTLQPIGGGALSAPPAPYLGADGWKSRTLERDDGGLNLNSTIGRGDRANMLLSEVEPDFGGSVPGAKSVPPPPPHRSDSFSKSNGAGAVDHLREMMKNTTFNSALNDTTHDYFNGTSASRAFQTTSFGATNNPTKESHATPHMQSVLSKLYSARDSDEAIPSFEKWEQLGTSATLRYDTLTVDKMTLRFGPPEYLSAKEDLFSCLSYLSIPSAWDVLAMEDYESDINTYASHLNVPNSSSNSETNNNNNKKPPGMTTKEMKEARRAETSTKLAADAKANKSGNDVLREALASNAKLLKKFVVEKPEEEKLKNKVRQWSDRCVLEMTEKYDAEQDFSYPVFAEDPQDAHEVAMLEALREEEEVRTRKIISRRRLEQQGRNKRGSTAFGTNSSSSAPPQLNRSSIASNFSNRASAVERQEAELERQGKPSFTDSSTTTTAKNLRSQFQPFGGGGDAFQFESEFADLSADPSKGVLRVLPTGNSTDGGRSYSTVHPSATSTNGAEQGKLTEMEKNLLDFGALTVLARCSLKSMKQIKETGRVDGDLELVRQQGYAQPSLSASIKDLAHLRQLNNALAEDDMIYAPEQLFALPLRISLSGLKPLLQKSGVTDAVELVVDVVDMLLDLPIDVLTTLKSIGGEQKGFNLHSSQLPASSLAAWRGVLLRHVYSRCPGFSPTDKDVPTIERFAVEYSQVVQSSRWRVSVLKRISDLYYTKEVVPALVKEEAPAAPIEDSQEAEGPPLVGNIPVVPGKRDLFQCDIQNLYISSSLAVEELQEAVPNRLGRIRTSYTEECLDALRLSVEEQAAPANPRSVSFASDKTSKNKNATASVANCVKGWKVVSRLLDLEAEYAQVALTVVGDEKLIAKYNRLVEPYNRFQQVQKRIWGPLYKSALRISYLLCKRLASHGLEHLPEEYITLLHPVSQFVGCTGGHREMRVKLQEVLLEISERAKRVRLPVDSFTFDKKGDVLLDEAAHAATVCRGGASDVVSCLATELDVLGLAIEKVPSPELNFLAIEPLYAE
ncbi:hypothetical protein ADEAN_000327000 [Angomonas deanei]|uniref:Uncharacterized protein n=1 Tax=Angomonas deanei TaxID=59799 RepID=A0A7G2CCJ5_9TRYP|nr:hypothetical protein ADEAN_000327000 [Angomonas deanei]